MKLVAEVDDVERIEPLPDIDFNIRSGNTLVGFATQQEIYGRLFATDEIKRKVADADRALTNFRNLQTRLGVKSNVFKKAKKDIEAQLESVRKNLDESLMEDYGQSDLKAFRDSHYPFHWYLEFNHVLANGSFDVIVGNPPYVEYSEVKDTYTVKNFFTEKTGNLYAFVSESIIKILKSKGFLGVIIPVASVCTDGYTPLQQILRNSGNLIISNFNDRPSKLFDNLEHIRLSIILCNKHDHDRRSIFTTKYYRWQSVERPTLFETLSFIDTADFAIDGSIPKMSSELERNILKKMCRQHKTLAHFAQKKGDYKIFYTRKLSHFVQILDFIPAMTNAQGKKRNPSELKIISFNDEKARDAWLAVLNSNLFYWFLTLHSDCRNLNKREIYMIPFDFGSVSTKTKDELSNLVKSLMADFNKNSILKTVNYKKWGQMSIQNIFPRLSKSVIDQIDQVLAHHYGFNESGLYFIVNYDIKYRVGADDDTGDDEE